MESKFFRGRTYTARTERKKITVTGNKENEEFRVELSIDNNLCRGNLYFKSGFQPLSILHIIPEHIHKNQRHNWLYLYYQKPENWTNTLVFDFKNFWYKCCGEDIRGRYNFCHTCGKKQEVNGVVIESIIGKELLTRLS
jgi:hypothetical protein